MAAGSVARLRRFIAFAVVATLAACSGATPELPPDEGALLVTETRGGIALLSPSDGARTELRPADGSPGPTQPTASRDGRRIVWTEPGPPSQVAVWEDGEITDIATPVVPFFFLWSPDADSVFALGNDPEGGELAGVLIRPDAGSAETLATAAPFYVDWYPDGEALASHRDSAELGRLSPDGDVEALDLAPGPFQAPAVTPAGDLVVAVGSGGGGTTAGVRGVALSQASTSELTLVPADGSEPRVLLPLDGPSAFALDPGGQRVAVAEGTPSGGHRGRLIVVGLDGTGLVEVADERPLVFEWSPDGTRLLYMIVDTEEATLIPHVWDGSASRSYPAFRPTPTTAREYLPFWDQYERSLTLWSPTGDGFVYAGVGDGDSGRVSVQRLDDDQPVEVGAGEWASWIPTTGERG